jgi:drug/metabolite transporter (DMT)-like permease
VRPADLVLLLANLVYATSYVVTRVALDHVPPALLALGRLAIAAAVLWPVVRALEAPAPAPSYRDAWRIVAMGAVGFAGAYACSHWGLARSTATNAALLIIVEPVSIMLLSPALLGERLRGREAAGAAVALVGVVLVVLNGAPGVTHALAPQWRGDLLLVLAGVAYGAYTLIGRHVLARHSALVVTARSIAWGAVVMVPLAVAEWLGGAWPAPNVAAIAGLLYLAVVITALGYLVWNWALARVSAPRASVFLTVQPIGGAVLGVVLLGEPLTAFTVVGGVLIVLGLWVTVAGGQ